MSISFIFLKIVNVINLIGLNIVAQGGDSLEQQLSDEFNTVTDPSNITEEGVPAIGQFVQSLVNFAIPIAVISCLFLLVYAGYTMVTSQGNPEKLTEAKEIVTNALSGFALIVLSTVILILINNTLKLGIPY